MNKIALSLVCTIAVCGAIASKDVPADSSIPWIAFNGGGSRSGINSLETGITRDNVADLSLLWSFQLENGRKDPIDSAPIFWPQVLNEDTGDKVDMLFLHSAGMLSGDGSEGDTLYAVNADTGAILWQNKVSVVCPTDDCISKSTPALDPSGAFVYCAHVDGTVRKYKTWNGEEVTGNGFPVVTTTDPVYEQHSAPLNIIGNTLYVTTSGDNHDDSWYVGHIVAVDMTTGETNVWNALCSNQRFIAQGDADCPVEDRNGAGIWSRGSVVDGGDGSIFVATGNGLFNANSGGYYWGDSLVRLQGGLPNVTDVMLDSYTPSNYDEMKAKDYDLGSSSPCILPTIPESSTPNMLVQASKDFHLRLINRDNMSGQGCCGKTGGEVDIIDFPDGFIFNHPLAWTGPDGAVWVFVITTDAQAPGSEAGLHAYQVLTNEQGVSTLSLKYSKTPFFGSSPFMANNILFAQGELGINAFEPTTGEVLWTSSLTKGLHWQSPIVVNSRVYSTDNNGNIYAWGL